MCGSTLTTSSTKTSAPTTSPPGGTWSIGTQSPSDSEAKLPKVVEMDKLRGPLVIAEVVICVLLMAGVLLQTPKATGLGGTIGGGDGGLGGGYRTRRGLERQIYWTTWVLVVAFLVISIGNIWVSTHSTT